MKITKEHVGKKVSHEGWEKSSWLEVLYICPSNDFFLGLNQEGKEDLWPTGTSLNYLWKLYHEPFMIDGKAVKVGDKIQETKWPENIYLIVKDISARHVTGVLHYPNFENKHIFEINRDWKFYQEPKPKKLVAPALFYSDNENKRWVLSDSCFEDLETAKKYFKPTYKVVWPAVPNAQGFFEVPE